ncbi:MAG: ATP-grasp domain-containing protein, partial [Myxococcota bacterium]
MNTPPNLTLVEEALWVVNTSTGMPIYDFEFEAFFACRHPIWLDNEVVAIARMGAAPDYAKRYQAMLEWGIKLIHSPEQYALTSHLPKWYTRLEDLTPRSYWFEQLPQPEEIERRFEYPIFIKGERQTNKHNRHQSIIETPDQLRDVLSTWKRYPILSWQRLVCREFLPLRLVAPDRGSGLPLSFEFRTFWWKERCIGLGPYWTTPRYRLSSREEAQVLKLGEEAARRLQVTFLVVDIAQTVDGRWVVIECNDGQDSGYAGVDRRTMWQRLID